MLYTKGTYLKVISTHSTCLKVNTIYILNNIDISVLGEVWFYDVKHHNSYCLTLHEYDNTVFEKITNKPHIQKILDDIQGHLLYNNDPMNVMLSNYYHGLRLFKNINFYTHIYKNIYELIEVFDIYLHESTQNPISHPPLPQPVLDILENLKLTYILNTI